MFDEKCWELAGLFLGDEPEMLTPEHQRALAQAIHELPREVHKKGDHDGAPAPAAGKPSSSSKETQRKGLLDRLRGGGGGKK